MLLKSLYDYAHERKLLETLPFEDRLIHAIVPLDLDGSLRLQHLIPQSTPDAKGKERPGRRLSLPSYPGEPNGGKAYFLAESAIAVFGRDKVTGEPIWADPVKAPKANRNDPKLFRDFWRQIETAYDVTNDSRLAAMLRFRDRYLIERDSKIMAEFSFLTTRSKQKARTPDQVECVAMTGTEKNQSVPTKDAVFAFSVDGTLVVFGDDQDTLRQYWNGQFYRDFSTRNDEEPDDADEDRDEGAGEPTSHDDSICLITGAIGQPVARSHNPRIRGVPFLTQQGVQRSNGRIVSFNRERPAFSSYGLSQGANAPTSQSAAASYALALNAILRDENARFDVGPLAFCIWAKETPQIGSQFKRLLEKGFPEHVQDVFGSLYSGIDREKVRNSERLRTVAITCATKARVAIKYWLDLPLAEAESKFGKWWDDLRIVSLFPIPATNESTARNQKGDAGTSPYGLRRLGMATIRQSKDHKDDKLVTERIVQLYRAALEGTAPSLMLLKPILDEFHSALLKNDPRIDPFNPSRFAFIKLILIRNHALPEFPEGKEGAFVQLVADTTDDAYNCGRLLAVMEALQNRSRKAGRTREERKATDRPNAGVIARYYGRASTAPATVFAMLLGLSHHHESKLQRGNEADKKAAGWFERRKIEILSRLRPDANVPNSPPNFPKLLRLVEQGRFALGFYHQKAHDREELRRDRETEGKEGDDLADSDDAAEET